MPPAVFLNFLSYTPISASLTPSSPNNRTTSKSSSQTTPPLPININESKELSLSDLTLHSNNATVKVRTTPPWVKGPLHLQPHELPNLTEPRNKHAFKNGSVEKSDRALTAKERGVRGNKAVKKIVRSIERLQQKEEPVSTQLRFSDVEIGESLKQLGGDDGELGVSKKLPWVRDEKVVYWRMKKEKVITKAESILDKELLERLRVEASRMRNWVKVKKAGVIGDKVDEIRLAWRRNELAMVKFDLPLCRNMDRAREILEMKTGGLVVWTKKDIHVVYRGPEYWSAKSSDPISLDERVHRRDAEEKTIATDTFVDTLPVNGSLFEREVDRLLDGLGPRFVDWWMRKPLPVDADLLPEVIPGFRPPLRLCPPHVGSKLKDDELTYLRKLAQAQPIHFVLGRNRRLQGLAAAIIKLWKKSLIAKIAVKWGALNTDNEQMSYELKCLTGGVLLLRNKFFIILYRGKDFLPCEVANVIADRENELRRCQLNEESARLKAIKNLCMADEPEFNSSNIGTLNEFYSIQMKFEKLEKADGEAQLQIEAEKQKLERELRNHEHKLSILKIKIEKSAKELSKLNSAWAPSEKDGDQEIMTEEERQCYRKMGLQMQSRLVLGRRGVYNGVIEGLHQHWKHREVVKVITMQKLFAQVIYTAKALEAESGGILVSVDKLKEGHAVILYRGKNYRRPLKLLAENLLTKREALRRSLLMQRIGSLKFFAYQRQHAISELEFKLVELQKSAEKNCEGHHYELTDISK